MNKESILGLIPARYASTRFPGKPLANICGKPMIQRVYEQVAQALPHVCVATDDNRIADTVIAFGGRVVMTSTNHRSGTDRCAEAVSKVEAEDGRNYSVVLNIQGDEPFINPTQVNLLASAFDDPNVMIATLVKKVECHEDLFNPNKPKVAVAANGDALYFSRSVIPYLRGIPEEQWLEKHDFYNHIGLYAYRTSTLHNLTKLEPGTLELSESLEQLRWLENGYRIKVLQTTLESISIDTPEDLQRVERMFGE